MAIVEKSKKTPDHWEEFAVLRLSARELAGIAALAGEDKLNRITYKFYNQIDQLLGGLNNYDQVDLNATYGEV